MTSASINHNEDGMRDTGRSKVVRWEMENENVVKLHLVEESTTTTAGGDKKENYSPRPIQAIEYPTAIVTRRDHGQHKKNVLQYDITLFEYPTDTPTEDVQKK